MEPVPYKVRQFSTISSFITTFMFIFIKNLLSFRNVLANWQTLSFWAMLKSVLVIAGPAIVREILTALLETAQTVPLVGQDAPELERRRLLQNLKLRLGQRLLGLNESQFTRTMAACGRSDELQIA